MKEEFKDHSHICKIVYKRDFVADVWENIKEVVTDTDYIRITTHTGKKTWVQIDNIQRITISSCLGKNFVGDYGMGYDTARDDIKEFCKNKNSAYIEKARTEWNSGYISALIDVIEHIERM